MKRTTFGQAKRYAVLLEAAPALLIASRQAKNILDGWLACCDQREINQSFPNWRRCSDRLEKAIRKASGIAALVLFMSVFVSCDDADGDGTVIELGRSPSIMQAMVLGMDAEKCGHLAFWKDTAFFNYLPNILSEAPFRGIDIVRISGDGYLFLFDNGELEFRNIFGGPVSVDSGVQSIDLVDEWIAYSTRSEIIVRRYDGVVLEEVFRAPLQNVIEVRLSLDDLDVFIFARNASGILYGMKFGK